jgi:soluble P-type ATPase
MTQQWTPEDSDAQERREARAKRTRELQTQLVQKFVVQTLREAEYEVVELGDGAYDVSALSDGNISVSLQIRSAS